MSLPRRLLLVLQLLAALSAPRAAHASIAVLIDQQVSYGRDGLRQPVLDFPQQRVRVRVSSTSAVQSVQMQIGPRVQALTPEGAEYWGGTVTLEGLAYGTYTMRASAVNVDNEQASQEFMLPYDLRPSVTVSSPQPGAVARPGLRVAARCADDGPGGCVRLTVRYSVAAPDVPDAFPLLAMGTQQVDSEVDLSAYEGTQGELRFEGVDARGQTGYGVLSIRVETSPELVALETLDGSVLDLDATRVVVLGGDRRSIRLYDRLARTYTLVASDLPVDDFYPIRPFTGVALAQDAVLFSFDDRQDPASASAALLGSAALYVWRAGQRSLIGHVTNGALAAAGRYAIWSELTTLTRRDLQSQVNTMISGTAVPGRSAVAPTGDVWFVGDDGQVHRYRNGTSTQLTRGDTYRHFDVLGDGERIVYGKSSTSHGIATYGPEGEELLDVDRPQELAAKNDYQIAGGFVAYTSFWQGALQVFLRRPDGSKLRLTEFAENSSIEALSPTGGVMLRNASKRYHVPPGGTPARVGSTRGKAVSIAGKWQFVVGGTIYGLASELPPDAAVQAQDAGSGLGPAQSSEAGPTSQVADAGIMQSGSEDPPVAPADGAVSAGEPAPYDEPVDEARPDGELEQDVSPAIQDGGAADPLPDPSNGSSEHGASDCAVSPGAHHGCVWAAGLLAIVALRLRRRVREIARRGVSFP